MTDFQSIDEIVPVYFKEYFKDQFKMNIVWDKACFEFPVLSQAVRLPEEDVHSN